jgi:hypothetical protein
MPKAPQVKIVPPTESSPGARSPASTIPSDPFVIMLKSPGHLNDPDVFLDTTATIARLKHTKREPRIAFTESDVLTEADVETVRELARESGVEEISVHGRRAK